MRWGEGVKNDITFDHTLYTGADLESFGGVDAAMAEAFLKCGGQNQ